VDSIHAGEMCLILGGNVEAGDFFRVLRKRETRNGPSFHNRLGEVKSFPEQLTVRINAGLDKCTGKQTRSCDRCNFLFDEEFMNSLRFRAYWKDGFHMQKVEIDVLSVEQSNELARVAPAAGLWKYELSINSRNIPLTNSLIIVVISGPDGRIVSRLSGKL
jgi:hypothetical protein